MSLAYRIELRADDNGSLLVTCPALPEVTTFGENEAEALQQAVAAIEEALAARIADGRDIIPEGESGQGALALPALTALKVELYRALRRTGISRAALARRLGWKRESVDRLFRLDHQSRLSQIEAAFHALGCVIDLRVDEMA